MTRFQGVAIRPASTVVVLRDGQGGPEVFLVRRNFTVAFMAGAHVFPGGRVDSADADVDSVWCDLPAGLADDGPAIPFRVAALRELFEEAGVLLARDATGSFVVANDEAVRARFDQYRDDVHASSTTLRAIVEREHLRLALDAVVPFARWVTPPIEVRRFDTWFFLAKAPIGQRLVHDRHESVASEWMSPATALARGKEGTMHLPPPTWATLRELEPFDSVEAAMAWASNRLVVVREPLIIEENGAAREIVLPGDPSHPAREQVRFETRFIWAGDRWLPRTSVR